MAPSNPNKNPVPADPRKIPYMTAYGVKPRVQLQCNDLSRTKQSFSAECDINNIMAKYQKTGLVSHVAQHQGNYDNLPSNVDYHENMNAMIAADEAFASLTSSIRSKFHNDPAEFLEFVHNDDNADELVEMGLAHSSGVPKNDNKPPPNQGNAAPEDKADASASAES